jgi:large subunit ribosomal protein L17
MRHGKKFNHLSRKKGHRDALMKSLSMALIKHKRINTTLAKAKALRVFIEPLITKSKTNTTHNRRVVFSYLTDKDSITELFGPIAEKVGDRPGGYTRIIKTGFRKGDSAEMAMIELVDFNEVMLANKADTKTAGRRRRRRRGGASGTPPVATQEEE